MHSLASLGVTKDSYSTTLVPIILGKLPVSVRRNLTRDHDQLRWTLDNLQAAVVKEIRVLESGLYTMDSSPSLSTRTHTTASFHAAIRGRRHPTSGGKKTSPTDDNPTGLSTSGISAEQLKSSYLWLHGPFWLTSTDQWPTWSPANVLHL